MKSLQEYLGNEKAAKEFFKHPRHKLLDEMVKRINADRVGTKYKPLSVKIIGIKTAHLGIDDLGFLLKRMQQSMFPGKVFFGSLKVNK